MRRDGYLPIAHYGIIGDSRIAALVGADGAVDWCCLPRFDSASVFGRLLDADHGGHFTVRPTAPFRWEQRYLGPTNVLQTTFTTETGTVRLTDFMPALPEARKERHLYPYRQICRRVECLEGRVEMEAIYQPRPHYATRSLKLQRRSPTVISGQFSASALYLVSDFPLEVHGESAGGRCVMGSGQRYDLLLSYSEDAPAVLPLLGEGVDRLLEETVSFWRAWSDVCRYRGPYREAVVRSALALKLMTYAPSGAVIAAPTTSLPEKLGGVRNWDYRYCWLRDAAFTVRALFALGYLDEGEAFVQWLLHATHLTHPRLQVVYSIHGEASLPEETLDHLDGYAHSRPVRVGNGASTQLQMDLYGEVMDAVHLYHAIGGKLDQDTVSLVLGMAEYVARNWRQPDDGIWEVRSGRAHHVHSKVLCWVTLHRAMGIAEREGLIEPLGALARTADEIAEAVHRDGYNRDLQSYVHTFGGDDLDASLLVLPMVGFVQGGDPRMAGTIRAIQERLSVNGLVYRYRAEVEDGLPPGEGAFGLCSFWLVQALALAGRLDEAHDVFQRVLRHANHLGLFAEEIDPNTGEFLGNFPQAFTHIGLINAALTLQEMEDGQPRL